jgi:hypothetical protein
MMHDRAAQQYFDPPDDYGECYHCKELIYENQARAEIAIEEDISHGDYIEAVRTTKLIHSECLKDFDELA